jgi:hypothetical protein
MKKQALREFLMEFFGVFTLCYFGGLASISLPYSIPIINSDKEIGIPVTFPVGVAHGLILTLFIAVAGAVKNP